MFAIVHSFDFVGAANVDGHPRAASKQEEIEEVEVEHGRAHGRLFAAVAELGRMWVRARGCGMGGETERKARFHPIRTGLRRHAGFMMLVTKSASQQLVAAHLCGYATSRDAMERGLL
ncbi:MAG: hypothetical protein ACHQAY_07990 [Hyphomicrobiales bacterium]